MSRSLFSVARPDSGHGTEFEGRKDIISRFYLNGRQYRSKFCHYHVNDQCGSLICPNFKNFQWAVIVHIYRILSSASIQCIMSRSGTWLFHHLTHDQFAL